jgi:hypothetical protein
MDDSPVATWRNTTAPQMNTPHFSMRKLSTSLHEKAVGTNDRQNIAGHRFTHWHFSGIPLLRAYYVSMDNSSRAPGLVTSLRAHLMVRVTRIHGLPLMDPVHPGNLSQSAVAALRPSSACGLRIRRTPACTEEQPWCCISPFLRGAWGACWHANAYSKSISWKASYVACSAMGGLILAWLNMLREVRDRAAKGERGLVIMLEDDTRFDDMWRHKLQRTLTTTPIGTWHLLKLTGSQAQRNSSPMPVSQARLLRQECAKMVANNSRWGIFACANVFSARNSSFFSFGTAAFLMHTDNASTVLEVLEEALSDAMAIDVELLNAYVTMQLEMAESSQSILLVDTSLDSTHDTHEHHHR